jgi:hypothetical protein
MTRDLRQSDGSDLSWGFHHGKSRALIIRIPDSAIPDFPKWEILQHVASVIRMTQIYFGVFTMENPKLSSSGFPIPRFPISRNGNLMKRGLHHLDHSDLTQGFRPYTLGS